MMLNDAYFHGFLCFLFRALQVAEMYEVIWPHGGPTELSESIRGFSVQAHETANLQNLPTLEMGFI